MSDKSVAGINNPFDSEFPVDDAGKDQVVEEQKQKAIAYRKVIEEAALEGPDVLQTFVDAFAPA